jgi:thioredoxin-like negative regulator of GroEL
MAHRVLLAASLVLAAAFAAGGEAKAAAATPQAASPQTAARLKTQFYAAVTSKDDASAVRLAAAYLAQVPSDDTVRLDYAYALLRLGRRDDARRELEAVASSRNPTAARAASKQLAALPAAQPTAAPVETSHPDALQQGYDASAKGDYTAAIDLLQPYVLAHPGDDRASLQLAYDLNAAGRNPEALVIFRRLRSSGDPAIAAKAQTAAINLTPARAYPRGSVFGYVINDSRFDDTFYGFDARYNLADTPVKPYLVAHLSSDTRSGAVGASAIYNYDALALNAGVSAPLGRYATMFVEGGQSLGLRGQTSLLEMRYGLTYYQEAGSEPGGHTTIGASAVHYSQFAGDAIAYGALAHDFPVAGVLRGVVGINGALDAQRLYYNNYGEVYGGLQIGIKPLAFRVIQVYGSYMGRGIAVPANSGYQTTRVELLFGSAFR